MMNKICFAENSTKLQRSNNLIWQNLHQQSLYVSFIQTVQESFIRFRTKIIVSIAFLCLFKGIGFSQEVVKQKYINIESGIDFVFGEMTKDDYIRGDVPTYYNNGESTKNLSILFYKKYLGLKTEVFSNNNKFGFSGGLRFTRMNGSVGKDTYWKETSDFFYLLFRQDGTTTEYLKIKEINQTSDYIGIPIEVRYFPRRMSVFHLYYKAGVEFDYRLQTKTNVVFYNDAMKTYQDPVSKMVGQPRSFCSVLYGAVGVKLGEPSKPGVNLEVCAPSVFLFKETSGLVSPISGIGFQLNIQVPIKSKAQ